MPQEYRYSITRLCLRSGELSLSPAMAALFPDEGSVTVVDTATGTDYRLEVRGPRRLAGIAGFFAAHELTVNDTIRIRPLGDGRIGLEALPRPERAEPKERTKPGERAEPEERAERSERSDRLERANVTDENVEAAETTLTRPTPKRLISTPPASFEPSRRARELLGDLGFETEGLPEGLFLAHARMGRRNYTVLVRALDHHELPDWAALMAGRREHDAQHLAVVGDHRDLHRLEAPAELARATLWSWTALERVRDLAAAIPLGPADLERQFEGGGLTGDSLLRFEENVNARLMKRGHLSAVLQRLAALDAPAVFVLDDVLTEDLQREEAIRILERLSDPPFELVARVGEGEYTLRVDVAEALDGLARYALSLRDQLAGQTKR